MPFLCSSAEPFVAPVSLALFLFAPVLVWVAQPDAPISASTNSTTATQSLTAKDAKQALAKAQDPKIGPGSGTWRYIYIDINGQGSGTNLAYFTNIIFELHSPAKRALRRTELFDSATTNARPHVQVDNEEGSWSLHDSVAVFFPPSGAKASRGIVKNAGGGFDWNLDPIRLDDKNPELASDVEVSGERFQKKGSWFLLITSRYGEKSRVKITQMFKKRIPILFRPFLKASELRKLVDEVVPVRYEWVLEPDTCTVLVSRGYRSDGQLIFETQGWQVWTNLPPQDYAVPKDITRLHPKSRDEADRVDSQIVDSP